MWKENFDENIPLLPLIGVALISSVCTYLILSLFSPKNNNQLNVSSVKFPKWYEEGIQSKEMRLLHVDEWKNKNGVYRHKNGW